MEYLILLFSYFIVSDIYWIHGLLFTCKFIIGYTLKKIHSLFSDHNFQQFYETVLSTYFHLLRNKNISLCFPTSLIVINKFFFIYFFSKFDCIWDSYDHAKLVIQALEKLFNFVLLIAEKVINKILCDDFSKIVISWS